MVSKASDLANGRNVRVMFQDDARCGRSVI